MILASTPEPQATTQPLSLQEIFDRATLAVIAQGQRCMADGSCAYRGAGGLKCAVGHLITDEVYASYTSDERSVFDLDNQLEGNVVTNHLVHDAVATSLGYEPDQRTFDMLAWLQKAHDNLSGDNESAVSWLRQFSVRVSEIADVYNLNVQAAQLAISAKLSELARNGATGA